MPLSELDPNRRIRLDHQATTTLVGRRICRTCSTCEQCMKTLQFSYLFCSCPYYNRQKEPPPSESDTTSLTRPVAGAERLRTTSRRRHVRVVATPRPRWGTTIGVRRPRAGEPLAPDVCDTWRPWPVGSKMGLGRVHRRRRWLPARIKWYYQ